MIDRVAIQLQEPAGNNSNNNSNNSGTGTGTGSLSSPQIGGITSGIIVGVFFILGLIWMGIKYRRRALVQAGETMAEDMPASIDNPNPPEIGGLEVPRSELPPVEGERGLGHELAGGYQAHGLSELEGEPWQESWSGKTQS